ncbi:MAG: hypothetical protein ACOC0Z_06025 [Halohasta sp.]
MVEVNGFEIVVTSFMIMILGTVLYSTGLLSDAITLFVFMMMGLLGFLAVRMVRGRKFSWR